MVGSARTTRLGWWWVHWAERDERNARACHSQHGQRGRHSRLRPAHHRHRENRSEPVKSGDGWSWNWWREGLVNPFDCEIVMIGGLWLPAVAGIERTPVYVGDYERAVSGVLRTAHVGKAMEWRVLLQGVAGEDVEALEEVLRSPVPVGCNIMGTEVIASVTELSSAHNPKRHGPDADWGRMNYEILVREVVVEQIMPGFTYEYQAFFDTGSFVWDWDAAGQPDEIDVILVAGGGGGGMGTPWEGTPLGAPNPAFDGGGGGGAGGVAILSGVPVSGNVSGSVGAGGAGSTNGQDTVFGAHTAIGGGAGGDMNAAGAAGGSGGGAGAGNHAGGAGESGQGHRGGNGNAWLTSSIVGRSAAAGGGATQAGPDRTGNGGGSRSGGLGLDLLSVGWNYRLVPGVPRYVAGGGGAANYYLTPGAGGIGGGGHGGAMGHLPTPGGENTGGGGGGGRVAYYPYGGTPPPNNPGAAGGSGLVRVRWLVSS